MLMLGADLDARLICVFVQCVQMEVELGAYQNLQQLFIIGLVRVRPRAVGPEVSSRL
jgi:hypothetical protein